MVREPVVENLPLGVRAEKAQRVGARLMADRHAENQFGRGEEMFDLGKRPGQDFFDRCLREQIALDGKGGIDRFSRIPPGESTGDEEQERDEHEDSG